MLNKSVKYNVASFKINDNIYNITKNNIEEIAQEIEDEMFNEIEEYEKIDKLEEERNIEPQVEVVAAEVVAD